MNDLIQRFLAGDRRALARLLSHAENRTELGREAIRATFARTGDAHVVGVTGPPGAGKSTTVNAMIRELRQRGKSVGVLAIDPSSTRTGGATLGDRIRMMENYDDPGVFIRSLATRGQLGGLSLAVGACTHLLDAFGFDMIVIETVGVGQAEVDVAGAADTTVLLQVPGLGDEVQAIKAGILEVADILVVNKADRPDARQLVRELRTMLLLGEHGDRVPPIVETIATEGAGVRRLVDEIEAHRRHLLETGQIRDRVAVRLRGEVELLARERFRQWIVAELHSDSRQDDLAALTSRRIDPEALVDVLLADFGRAAAESVQT